MADKVYIGMSGGVDSSVAAYLLKEQGYEVTGVTMRLCDGTSDNQASDSIELARLVAERLDIDFEVVDYRDEFRKFVVEPFVATYENGQTPNPCIECNRCIKFDLMMKGRAVCSDNNSCNSVLIATGHYAHIEYSDGRYKLRKSANLQKDQSYFLYTLSQATLARVILPLGDMDKDEVRRIAEDNNLINAKRKDSQDICFIPDGDYASFIKSATDKIYPEGNFVDIDGNILGRHKGIINYTLGQRKGLGLSLKKPMYVYKLDTDRNEVILADNDALFSSDLTADNFNWVSIDNPGEPFRALGRIRYRHKEAPCTVTPNSDGSISVHFDEPQRAITAGQSLVLYDEESATYVLGGGIII